jgi:DNA-binding Xre family transcriptional regulator
MMITCHREKKNKNIFTPITLSPNAVALMDEGKMKRIGFQLMNFSPISIF